MSGGLVFSFTTDSDILRKSTHFYSDSLSFYSNYTNQSRPHKDLNMGMFLCTRDSPLLEHDQGEHINFPFISTATRKWMNCDYEQTENVQLNDLQVEIQTLSQY